jgi:hypothetical protein
MDVPRRWRSYDCTDYFASSLARTGWYDEESRCQYIEPASSVREDPARELLVIGRPGVDGIEWGYRRGLRGLWAHYPIENRFVHLASTAQELRDGYATGRITV